MGKLSGSGYREPTLTRLVSLERMTYRLVGSAGETIHLTYYAP
jgi:hypothetical protein